MLCRWAPLPSVAQILLASWLLTRALIRTALTATPSRCLSEIGIYGMGWDDPCICQAWEKTIEASGLPLLLLWPWMVMHTLPKMSGRFMVLWDIDGLDGIISSWSIDRSRWAGTLKTLVTPEMNELGISFLARLHVLPFCKGLALFICVFIFTLNIFFSLTNKSVY